MSSHREAPEISKDPVADSTDLYAFVSPDAPNTVTLIANYLPLEGPAAGPNFYEFGDDVLYEILIDNDGDARPDISFQFRFQTTIRNQKTFLYNTGPIQSLASPELEPSADLQPAAGRLSERARHGARDQSSVSTVQCRPALHAQLRGRPGSAGHSVGRERDQGVRRPTGGGLLRRPRVHLRPRDLRPFQQLHATFGVSGPLAAMAGINSTNTLNVHSLALQIPKSQLTAGGSQSDRSDEAELRHRRVDDRESPEGEVQRGVPRSAVRDRPLDAGVTAREPAIQRGHRPDGLQGLLGTPVSLPTTANSPSTWRIPSWPTCCRSSTRRRRRPDRPEGAFPKLFSYNNGSPNRVDLLAILLTGIPTGTLSVAPTFQNFTGPTQADMLRLNMAIGPSAAPTRWDCWLSTPPGFPQRSAGVFDDVVTIELRCIAGVLHRNRPRFPNPGDAAAGAIYDLVAPGTDTTVGGTENYLLQLPLSGSPPQWLQRPERSVMTLMSSHEHTHVARVHTHTHTTRTRIAQRIAEDSPGPSEGAVFIDVGPGVGAAVIYTERRPRWRRTRDPAGLREWRGLHTAVRDEGMAMASNSPQSSGAWPRATGTCGFVGARIRKQS